MFAIALATTTLIAGIGWTARTRYFVSNIDGPKPVEGSPLDIAVRYTANTTEQLIIFIAACLFTSVADPEVAPRLLPVLASWFVVARLSFFVGYRLNPILRSVGFAATFHPTIFLMVYAFGAFVL